MPTRVFSSHLDTQGASSNQHRGGGTTQTSRLRPTNFTASWHDGLALGWHEGCQTSEQNGGLFSDRANVQFWASCCSEHSIRTQQEEVKSLLHRPEHSCGLPLHFPSQGRGKVPTVRHRLTSVWWEVPLKLRASRLQASHLALWVTCSPEACTM